MNFVDQSTAKGIVKRDLRNWQCTTSQFKEIVEDFKQNNPRITTIEKREEILFKKSKLFHSIFHRYISAPFSSVIALTNLIDESKYETLSKSQKKEIEEKKNQKKRYLHKMQSRRLNVYVTKDDVTEESTDLVVMIFNPHKPGKDNIMDAYEVCSIKKHCLERIVQRLGLSNINEAIDEILTAIMPLELSCREIATRKPPSDGSDYSFRRHVPTKNGALLIEAKCSKHSSGEYYMVCNLITWINKNQFFTGQEVTASEFNFVQFINYLLSSPKLEQQIGEWKKGRAAMDGPYANKCIFSVNGYEYEYDYFMTTLEQGKYLDFIIEFEKQ
ncbi:hypothetical protein FIP36_16580 [Salmonella enterica]|nr:hypothetical protein [Salmonella enterica]